MAWADYIGYAAAFCTTSAYVPQVVRVWRTRSTGDISLKMFSGARDRAGTVAHFRGAQGRVADHAGERHHPDAGQHDSAVQAQTRMSRALAGLFVVTRMGATHLHDRVARISGRTQ